MRACVHLVPVFSPPHNRVLLAGLPKRTARLSETGLGTGKQKAHKQLSSHACPFSLGSMSHEGTVGKVKGTPAFEHCMHVIPLFSTDM